jgi:gluconolactonase
MARRYTGVPMPLKSTDWKTTGAAVDTIAMSEARPTRRDWSGKEPIGYPDPDVVIIDPKRFRYRAGNAALERLYTGCRWAEGPAWNGNGRYLVWSDIPNNRQLRHLEEDGHVSVMRPHSNYSNGNTFDYESRQLSCEHDARRVVRYEPNGKITIIADQWQGKPLNAPNDIVVHPDGGIWFTDPGYGILCNYEGHVACMEIREAVYRVDGRTGKMEMVADDLYKPNGICFSPDYSKAYIVDTGSTHEPDAPKIIQMYDVENGIRLRNSRRFCSTEIEGAGIADGIRADIDGNIWAGCGWAGPGYDGVHVFAPDGERIGMILLPEVCANLCFGGRLRNRLFMAASQSLYSLYVETQGAHIC